MEDLLYNFYKNPTQNVLDYINLRRGEIPQWNIWIQIVGVLCEELKIPYVRPTQIPESLEVLAMAYTITGNLYPLEQIINIAYKNDTFAIYILKRLHYYTGTKIDKALLDADSRDFNENSSDENPFDDEYIKKDFEKEIELL